MRYFKSYKYKRILNTNGETLIELLISIFILTITLTLIITVFMSGRAGIVESWNRTEKIECASYVLEQLKALPYDTLFTWESKFKKNGVAKEININAPEITLVKDQQCADMNEIQFDLLSYETYLLTEMMEVKVRVRNDDSDKWVEIGSLIRKGDD